MRTEVSKKEEINKKVLLMCIVVLAFLIFAYLSGEIVWFKDILLFTELISSILAVFIGTLALVRFYTKKTKLAFLLLGIGFVFVGVLEGVQLLTSLNGFGSLFVYTEEILFPLGMVLAKTFLSIILFLSWFVRKDYEHENSDKEKIIALSVILLFLFAISAFVMFVNVPGGLQDHIPALIGGVLSMLLLLLGIIGYLRTNIWKYESFEYWVIFSMIFLLISTIFFLPFLNLEHELTMIFSVLARFLSYLFILIGFLVSIHEIYAREIEYLEELKEKNEILSKTRNSMEEAYMLLRKEKWDIFKSRGEAIEDSILKDIVKSNK